MIPIVTVDQMRASDASASVGTNALIQRAGSSVAFKAVQILGGTYGRRVVVVAGKGNNGADGRVAAERLRARGVRVSILEADPTPEIPICDLVIDAAYGTGFRGTYDAPDFGEAPVLSVDIPSGLNGDTGRGASAVVANTTVTFAGLKPGLLFGEGPLHSGAITVADIGVKIHESAAALITRDDVAPWLPLRAFDAHKWDSALYVVAGSPGMRGAARLCTTGALRSGAGMVRLGMPGVDLAQSPSNEVVGRLLSEFSWESDVLDELDRCKALVVGPGLGRSQATIGSVRALVAEAKVPLVIDGDGLFALGPIEDASGLLSRRSAPTILTPHDGEFSRLTGHEPRPDRLSDVADVAASTNATVLLKGPSLIVASPGSMTYVVAPGDPRFATAGTGDVLSGMIGAFLAHGLGAPKAAAAAAFVGRTAATNGRSAGFLAGDLPQLVADWLSSEMTASQMSR